jgi:hypothetical protein
MVNNGDNIIIGPGTYKESILIAERFGMKDIPLTIIGDESGKRTGDPAGLVVIESAIPGTAALRIHRSQDLMISGITFRGVGEGISLEKVRRGIIERCTFDQLTKGVTISECEDVRLESSVITRCIMGVLVKNATRTRLAHITLSSCNAAGIMISSSAVGEIRNSLILDNATGMVADVASAPSWSSDYNTINGTVGSWGLVGLCRIPYEWFAASGQERHSNYVMPAFIDPAKYDLHIEPTVSWGGGLAGMYVGTSLEPPVKNDRDGKPFTIRNNNVGTGAYNYPDPKPGVGWKKLNTTLPATGVRQSAAIYAKDGTLLRTLLADTSGIRELWWDGLDDTGTPVPAGYFEVRAITHDIQILDDGSLGDNGNPMGTFNCDNAERVVTYKDGSFVISTAYDEAGVPLRFYSASGQPVSGSALTDKELWAIAYEGTGKNIIAGFKRELQRIAAPGERLKMPNGMLSYPITTNDELLAKTADGKRDIPFGGIVVIGERILVTVPLAGGSVVRSFEMMTGKKIADWAVQEAGDIDADSDGNVWVLCGEEVVCLNPQGQITKRYAAGQPGSKIAVGAGQIAVISNQKGKIVFINLADGKIQRTLGKERAMDKWLPVSGDLYKNLRDGAFMDDGQFIICEAGRVRVFQPETGKETLTILSNFMDAAVPHPKNPEIIYCHGASIFRLDHAANAWSYIKEPPGTVAENLSLGQCITSGTVDGRQYLIVTGNDAYKITDEEKKANSYNPRRYVFIDITDPLNPRYAGALKTFYGFVYTDLRFDKDGNLCYPENSKMRIVVLPYLGRDENGYLRYPEINLFGKTANPRQLRGIAEKDVTPRGMFHKGGLTIDLRNNDSYLMACTPLNNKMVPAWGASGTGVGKMDAEGRPLWYTPSSGGNYTSISSVCDNKEIWVMAAKDFGGQVDLFSSDGLRLGTSNWNWMSNWTCGFVDLREGLQGYLRPDGKPGAHVEDDNVGRFNRIRVDGTDTLLRTLYPFAWTAGATKSNTAPSPHEVAGNTLHNMITVPKVTELPIDGDWTKWTAAKIHPQILSLPIQGWGRTFPQNALQTFEAGTSIGAIAHDGKNIYTYILTTDNTPNFHAPGDGRIMWEFDSIELWIEEEQIGLGFNNEGKPKLFKYRYHNRDGKEWSANYLLPDANIWGVKLDNIATHPLGQLLGGALGTSMDGKAGYAIMAKIPMEEVKLVGGISGRKGGEILPMTGKAGETFRIGIAFDGVTAWGREQDFKVYWPIGLMYSDPTTNVPFILGE